MAKKRIAVLILLLGICCLVWSQGVSKFSLNVVPGTIIPIGDSFDLYTVGASLGLNGEYFFSPLFYAKSALHYNMLPTLAASNMSIVDIGLGAGVNIPITPRLYLKAAGQGGYYYGARAGAPLQEPVPYKLYRVLPPGSFMTMDFNPERLNVYTDQNGLIIKATCG